MRGTPPVRRAGSAVAALLLAGCTGVEPRTPATTAAALPEALRPAGADAIAAALAALAAGDADETSARLTLHAAAEGAEDEMLARARALAPRTADRRVLLAAALARGAAADDFPWDERVGAWLRDLEHDPPPRTRALLASARLHEAGDRARPALRRAVAAGGTGGALAARFLGGDPPAGPAPAEESP